MGRQKAVHLLGSAQHGLRLRRLHRGVQPADPGAARAHLGQHRLQVVGRVGVVAVAEHHKQIAALQGPPVQVQAQRLVQATGNAGAAAKSEGDGVDLFLHPRAAPLHQRRDVGHAGVKHQSACVHYLHKSAGQAQVKLGVHFHGAAHVHQHHHARLAALALHAGELDHLATAGQRATQRAAQMHRAPVARRLQAAQQLGAQAFF